MTSVRGYIKKEINPTTGHPIVTKFFQNPDKHDNPIQIYFDNIALGLEKYIERTGDHETVSKYHDRWNLTMALNLDMYSIPLIAKTMVDEILNQDGLKEKIINIGKYSQYKYEKKMWTIIPAIISLYIAWKSGEWCVRYSRNANFYVNIKQLYYVYAKNNKDEWVRTNKIREGCSPYLYSYNRPLLNTLFDSLAEAGFIDLQLGRLIPEIGTGIQTRLFNKEKIINIFKKYEDLLDINSINYLRNMESYKEYSSDLSDDDINFPVVIRDKDKKDISISFIQNKIKTQLETEKIVENIVKINEYYSKNLEVEVTEIEDNYDIIKKFQRLEKEIGYINNDGHFVYSNIQMKRIFNNSCLEDGGRLYNTYQNDSKIMRRSYKINGEKSICLDMKASQINMLYHLENLECPWKSPYDLFEDYEGEIELSDEFIKNCIKLVKKLTLTTINASSLQSAVMSGYYHNIDLINTLQSLINNKDNENIFVNVIFDNYDDNYYNDCKNDVPIDYLEDKHYEMIEEARKQIEMSSGPDKKIYSWTSFNYSTGDPKLKYKIISEEEKIGMKLVRKIIGCIKTKHYQIQKYFHTGHGVKLQRKESNIMVNTILEMIDKHNTPVLSVHDEIIVQKSKVCEAHDIFINEYQKEFNGYSCILTDESGENFINSDLYNYNQINECCGLNISDTPIIEKPCEEMVVIPYHLMEGKDMPEPTKPLEEMNEEELHNHFFGGEYIPYVEKEEDIERDPEMYVSVFTEEEAERYAKIADKIRAKAAEEERIKKEKEDLERKERLANFDYEAYKKSMNTKPKLVNIGKIKQQLREKQLARQKAAAAISNSCVPVL